MAKFLLQRAQRRSVEAFSDFVALTVESFEDFSKKKASVTGGRDATFRFKLYLQTESIEGRGGREDK